MPDIVEETELVLEELVPAVSEVESIVIGNMIATGIDIPGKGHDEGRDLGAGHVTVGILEGIAHVTDIDDLIVPDQDLETESNGGQDLETDDVDQDPRIPDLVQSPMSEKAVDVGQILLEAEDPSPRIGTICLHLTRQQEGTTTTKTTQIN